MDKCIENSFEFLNGQDICTATLSNKRLINKVKKFAQRDPDNFIIKSENLDGSIVAHFPVKNLTIRSPKTSTNTSE